MAPLIFSNISRMKPSNTDNVGDGEDVRSSSVNVEGKFPMAVLLVAREVVLYQKSLGRTIWGQTGYDGQPSVGVELFTDEYELELLMKTSNHWSRFWTTT